jgi:hypothetical protein
MFNSVESGELRILSRDIKKPLSCGEGYREKWNLFYRI